jgi:hypothetical protein
MENEFRDFWKDIIISSRDIPQANRLHLITRFLCNIKKWPVSSNTIAEYLKYKPRQGQYYADAAELLGLIQRDSKMWKKTLRSQFFCESNTKTRLYLLREYALQIPIISIVLRLVESHGVDGVSIEDITHLASTYSDLDPSTLSRRMECIMSWLLQLGMVVKDSEGLYSHHIFDPQTSLD